MIRIAGRGSHRINILINQSSPNGCVVLPRRRGLATAAQKRSLPKSEEGGVTASKETGGGSTVPLAIGAVTVLVGAGVMAYPETVKGWLPSWLVVLPPSKESTPIPVVEPEPIRKDEKPSPMEPESSKPIEEKEEETLTEEPMKVEETTASVLEETPTLPVPVETEEETPTAEVMTEEVETSPTTTTETPQDTPVGEDTTAETLPEKEEEVTTPSDIVAEVVTEEVEESPKEEEVTPILVEEVAPTEEVPSPEPVVSEEVVTSLLQEAEELRSSRKSAALMDTLAALRLLREDIDESYLKDLDKATLEELKIRLVRLSTEMADRARYEAVRLKESMALKEVEVAEKYLDVLQRQRLDYEETLSRRLREQKEELTAKAKAVAAEREQAVELLLKTTAEAQSAEHEADLKALEESTVADVTARLTAESSDALAAAKADYASQLERQLSVIADLETKLASLSKRTLSSEKKLGASQSLHAVSAAALALVDALEDGAPVAVSVFSDDELIGATIRSLPSSVSTKGVPTVDGLRRRFVDDVFEPARRTCLAPEATSVGGQLLGAAVAILRVPPLLATDSEIVDDEGRLCAARRCVESGDLQGARDHLRVLSQSLPMVGTVVSDWVRDAEDRLAVDGALRTIKAQCALRNSSMASSE